MVQRYSYFRIEPRLIFSFIYAKGRPVIITHSWGAAFTMTKKFNNNCFVIESQKITNWFKKLRFYTNPNIYRFLMIRGFMVSVEKFFSGFRRCIVLFNIPEDMFSYDEVNFLELIVSSTRIYEYMVLSLKQLTNVISTMVYIKSRNDNLEIRLTIEQFLSYVLSRRLFREK